MKHSTYCGAALVRPGKNVAIQRSIDKSASIFTAECIALNDAMDTALNIKNKNVFIFSDSMSALQSLQSAKIDIKTNKYIFEIKKKYKTLSELKDTNYNIQLY